MKNDLELKDYALQITKSYIDRNSKKCSLEMMRSPVKKDLPRKELSYLISLLIKYKKYDVIECLFNSTDFCDGNLELLIEMFLSSENNVKKKSLMRCMGKMFIRNLLSLSDYSVDNILEWAFEMHRTDYFDAINYRYCM